MFPYFEAGNLEYGCTLQFSVQKFWFYKVQNRNNKRKQKSELNIFFWKVRMESKLVKYINDKY